MLVDVRGLSSLNPKYTNLGCSLLPCSRAALACAGVIGAGDDMAMWRGAVEISAQWGMME